MVCFYLLGIQAAKTVKTSKLSEFLHGFLEIITEDQFRQLQRLHYPSLYAMKYNPTVNSRSQKMYYFILFGPLALCNASKDVTTSFYCFDVMGDLLLKFECRCQYGIHRCGTRTFFFFAQSSVQMWICKVRLF
jgi:hypothetical protein